MNQLFRTNLSKKSSEVKTLEKTHNTFVKVRLTLFMGLRSYIFSSY